MFETAAWPGGAANLAGNLADHRVCIRFHLGDHGGPLMQVMQVDHRAQIKDLGALDQSMQRL